MSVEETREYAVEVPGRGYMAWSGHVHATMEDDDYVKTMGDAEKRLEEGRNKFTSMGCPDIASTLRIVHRIMTVVRSDWEPAPGIEIAACTDGPDEGKQRWECHNCRI